MVDGQVVFVSRNQGMIVVRHEDGFAVVELLGSEGELTVGDSVSGVWNALGGEKIRAHGDSHDVYMQGNWGVLQAAVDVARNTGGG
jgi:hypothetical protein